jgi:hypothetical protein
LRNDIDDLVLPRKKSAVQNRDIATMGHMARIRRQRRPLSIRVDVAAAARRRGGAQPLPPQLSGRSNT